MRRNALESKQLLEYAAYCIPNTKNHNMLAYEMIGCMAETDSSETKKNVSFMPDETTELTEGKWKFKKDGKPRIDDLMVDLIDHLCPDYKRSDFKNGKCDDGCPDDLPVSQSS